MSKPPLSLAMLLCGLLLGQGAVAVAQDRTGIPTTVEDVPALLEDLGRDAGIVDRRSSLIHTQERLLAVGERHSDAVAPMITEKLRTLHAEGQRTQQFQLALIRILARLGQAAEAAVPVLAEIVVDDDPENDEIRRRARSLLEEIGTPDATAAKRAGDVATMESWLRTASPAEVEQSVRRNAFLIRQQLRSPEMSTALIEPPVLNLLAIGPNAGAAVPVLLQAYNDPRVDEELRAIIDDALAVAGAPDAPTAEAAISARRRPMIRLEAVIADTRSEDAFIHQSAMMELAALGPSEPAIDALIDALRLNRSPGTVAQVLGEYGPAAARAAPFLLPYLRDPEAGADAVRVLGLLGSREPQIIDALYELSYEWSRQRKPPPNLALDALDELAVADLPGLIEALSSPSKETRIQAAESLGRVGRRAADAVPALAGLLADPDPDVYRSAAFVLQSIGGDAAAEALRDDARRHAEADAAAYRRLRAANDMIGLEHLMGTVPEARRIPLARLMIGESEPALLSEGIGILTFAGRTEETVPVLARMIVEGRIDNEALLSLNWMWLHSGDAQMAPRMMSLLRDHLSANLETYSEAEKARARSFVGLQSGAEQ